MANRLHMGNLSFDTGSDALRDAFARFGEVTDARLVADRRIGRALRVDGAERQGGAGKRARW